MAIGSVWADVPVVKGSDAYGIGADFITAQVNTEQNEALQSRDIFLLNKFNEYYTQNQIDNLLSSYTSNLDWKESVDTYADILTTYPTDISNYTWLENSDAHTYEQLLQLYPNDYNELIWIEPVDTYDNLVHLYTPDYNYLNWQEPIESIESVEDISTVYPEPAHNWGVEITSTNEKYRYDSNDDRWYKVVGAPEDKWAVEITSTGETYRYDAVNNSWNRVIGAPEENVGVILDDGTRYVFSAEQNKWHFLEAPAQDGWVVNVKDTNYTYRYDAEDDVWIPISANVIPLATSEVDGLLTKEDYSFIRSLGLESVYKKMGYIDEDGNITDLQGILDASLIPMIYLKMSQMEERSLPLGSILPYYVSDENTPPLGFVFAEGQELLRKDYPDMWEKLYKENDVGEIIYDYTIPDSQRRQFPAKFTSGNGDDTFRVPNLQGLFIRGWDYGNSDSQQYDRGREKGSFQNHAIFEHTHDVNVTGVGSIDDALINPDGRLLLAGTTANDYTRMSTVSNYTTRDSETRPVNVAVRYIIKVLPTDKIPLMLEQGTIPSIENPIDADTLQGHEPSITALPGMIPVADNNGQLDSSWFNTENIFSDNFVRRDEVSDYPTSGMIPMSNDAGLLDDWISFVKEDEVNNWISYLTNEEALDTSNLEDEHDINKRYLTSKKFVQFLVGLRAFLYTFKFPYTTEDVIPTNERGYISNAERLKYSDKYTKNETYQLIYNFLLSYVPIANTSTTPESGKIPIANEDGKLDPGWMSDLFLNKIGVDDTTGYAAITKDNADMPWIDIKAGVSSSSGTGKVTIQGGGDYSLSDISPAKTIISGYDLVGPEPTGGNVEIYAGSGGNNPSSIGGSVIIQSGTGSYYNGTIDLNNIKVDKNNTIYTNDINLKLQRNNGGVNKTDYLELTDSGITYMHDNLVDNSDDYIFTLNNDGTVETNRPNIPNGLAILNGRAVIPFENLPKTFMINNIGDFRRDQTINTSLGNVIVGTIGQNCDISISDDTVSTEARELTFVLTATGPYNVDWPINITWISGHEPTIDYDETAIIKLFRIGNGEWIGWKVGDGSNGGSGSTSGDILVNEEEVPPSSFNGDLHVYVTSTESTDNPIPTERTSLVLTAPENAVFGEDIEVSVAITPAEATGVCSFKVDDITNKIASIVNGVATATLQNISAGNHTIACFYEGDMDGVYIPSNTSTSIVIAKTEFNNIDITSHVDETEVVFTVDPNAYYDSGSIDIVLNDSIIGSGVIPFGEPATVYIDRNEFEPGENTINYSLYDFINFNDYFGTYTFDNTYIPPAELSLTAESEIYEGNDIVVTANVEATGTCTFTINTNPEISEEVLIENGQAVATFTDIPVGTYTITCEYSGDSENSPSTADIVLTVIEQEEPEPEPIDIPKTDSFTRILAQDINEGDNEIITIEVPEEATGNVELTIIDNVTDTTEYSNSAVIESGSAQFIISGLTVGEKTAIANYYGDSNYYSSVDSTVFNVSVNNG